MQLPAVSRKREAAPEEKKVKKLKQLQAHTVKVEGASASKAVLTPAGPDNDDDLQMTGVNINRNTDMDFWRNQASAREIRAQLNLRDKSKIGDWAFKSKQQLLDTVGAMIKNGTW